MSGTIISCPHCGQHLEAEQEHVGTEVDCPGCSQSFVVAAPSQEHFPATAVHSGAGSGDEQKRCPFCGELILAVARKCKHCGEFLDGSQSPSNGPVASGAPGQEPEKTLWEGHPSGLCYISHWIFGILLFWLYGLGLIIIAYAILDQKSKLFTLTTRKVIMQSGIISRSTQEVSIKDIRSINMAQGILERLCGLGTVQIGSAGTGGIEVEFKGIKNPDMVRDQVRRIKDDLEA